MKLLSVRYFILGFAALVLAGCHCVSGQYECSAEATCFVAGTPVLMADGSQKSIEHVAAGDRVMSFDEQTGQTRIAEVLAPIHHPKKQYGIFALSFSDGSQVEVTGEHSLFEVAEQKYQTVFTLVDRLKAGTPVQVLLSDGSRPFLKSADLAQRELPVYNLDIAGLNGEDGHNYFANGILVHNEGEGKDGGESGDSSLSFGGGEEHTCCYESQECDTTTGTCKVDSCQNTAGSAGGSALTAGTSASGETCEKCDPGENQCGNGCCGGQLSCCGGTCCDTDRFVCEKGKCKKKDCVALFGAGAESCGEGCCRAGSGCCGGSVCCDDVGFTCKDGWVADWCIKDNCSANEFECGAGEKRICCDKTKYDSCGITEIVGIDVQVCVKGGDGCKEGGPGYCAKDANDKAVCCPPQDKCVTDGGVFKGCTPVQCPNGSPCWGSGSASEASVCCAAGQTCTIHPNGYPKCI